MLKDVIDWQKRFDEFWRTMMDTPAKNLTETEAGEQVKHFISDLLTQLEREVDKYYSTPSKSGRMCESCKKTIKGLLLKYKE
jgi:hypothetical protein